MTEAISKTIKTIEGQTLVMGSRNKGKRSQLIDALSSYNLNFVMAEETDVEDPEETGSTFLENALIKAKAYSQGTNLPALSDDSGLVIPALDGAPGIYSARFAADHGGYDQAFQVLEEKLEGLSKQAYITSTVVLMWPDGRYFTGVGETWGDLVFPARKGVGFGYYPIFRPEGSSLTISEMSPDDYMNAGISHRQKSIKDLISSWEKSLED